MYHFSETQTTTSAAPLLWCSSQTHLAPPPRHGWCAMRRARYHPQHEPRVGQRESKYLTWYKMMACEYTPIYQIAPAMKLAHHEWHWRYVWPSMIYQTQMAQRTPSRLASPPQKRPRSRSETEVYVICDLDQCTATDSSFTVLKVSMRQMSSH